MEIKSHLKLLELCGKRFYPSVESFPILTQIITNEKAVRNLCNCNGNYKSLIIYLGGFQHHIHWQRFKPSIYCPLNALDSFYEAKPTCDVTKFRSVHVVKALLPTITAGSHMFSCGVPRFIFDL